MRERYTVWKVFARAWVLLVMLPLQVVACREDGDFHYYYVRDFRFFEPVRRVTQITQEKMFARRRGTYVADLGEDAERWRVRLGKNVRRLFIDVSTNKIARVFFECADGEYVTCSEFLKGRMSDTCFFWGGCREWHCCTLRSIGRVSSSCALLSNTPQGPRTEKVERVV